MKRQELVVAGPEGLEGHRRHREGMVMEMLTIGTLELTVTGLLNTYE